MADKRAPVSGLMVLTVVAFLFLAAGFLAEAAGYPDLRRISYPLAPLALTVSALALLVALRRSR